MRVTIKEACERRRDAAEPCRLPPEIETTLFRVVQEAINNIVRHALARSVRLIFTLTEEAMTVLIEDDGVGFDLMEVSLASDSGRGLGLIGMQERIELVGGGWRLTPPPATAHASTSRCPRPPGCPRPPRSPPLPEPDHARHAQPHPIRVLVVDDHAILRDGIRSLLERQPDILVVGEAGTARRPWIEPRRWPPTWC